MKTKSELTKEFIIDKVAPIFNKRGYEATSLSDLMYATKLSKGAIYGNFENKEDLAIQAFHYNVNRVMIPIKNELEKYKNSIDKLYALTNFYREYYDYASHLGGCPILNVATDTNNVNSKLFKAVKKISEDIEGRLVRVIQKGIEKKEISNSVNAKLTAKNIYAMIEGSVFMALMHQDKIYITEMMNHIDNEILDKIKM